MVKHSELEVSIIIVNFNAADMLKNCIDSIKAHVLFTSYEVIVVDNHSTDVDLNELLSSYEKVVIIKNNENRGFSAANNQGIRIAKGNYILFLNNDTLFLEASIEKILTFIKKLGKEVIVGCRLLNADKSHQLSVVDRDSLLNSFGENFFLYLIFKKNRTFNKYYYSNNEPNLPTKVDIIKGAFIFCSKNIVDKLSGFDERFFFYAEETDFCMRAQNIGFEIYYLPETEIIHFGGVTTDKMPWFRFKNQTIAKVQIYQKHFSGIQFLLLTLFHYLGVFIRSPIYFISGFFMLNGTLIKKSFYYLRQLFVYPKNVFKHK